MKYRLLVSAFAVLSCAQVHAQAVTYESVRIAELSVGRSWKSVEPLLPSMLAQLEQQALNQGATQQATRALSVELRKNISRDGMSRAIAQLLAATMTADEQAQALAFLQSPAGIKYQDAINGGDQAASYMLPLVRKSCAAAKAALPPADVQSLARPCNI